MDPNKMIPQNIEAEEALLGALLIDPEALFRVVPFLNANDFYIQKNNWIYEAILTLREQRTPVDFVTLCDELERREQLIEVGGAAYITRLINAVPSAIHVESYAHIVEHAAIRRRIIGAAGEIAQLAYQEETDIDQTVDQVEQTVFAVTQQRVVRDLAPIQDAVRSYYDRIEHITRHPDKSLGVPTGFIDMDRKLNGLQRSDFIIIAARPSVGKSALCFSIAHNAAKLGKQVALFSLEMSREQIVQRLVSAETGIPSQRLRSGKMRDDEWPAFTQATGKIAALPIHIDDTAGLTVLQMRAKTRRLHAERGLDLVVVDYLQLINADRRKRVENRTQEVSYITRSIKALARELDTPILVASQLSRAVEQRTNKRPILSDLRDSGTIEQDADVVMFIYRDEMYHPETESPNIAEIDIAKQRNGPTGVISLFFRKRLAQFLNAETRQINPINL